MIRRHVPFSRMPTVLNGGITGRGQSRARLGLKGMIARLLKARRRLAMVGPPGFLAS
jgi:hypothetical protein